MRVNMILAPMGKPSIDRRMLDPERPPRYLADSSTMIIHDNEAVGSIDKVGVVDGVLRATGVIHDPNSPAAHEIRAGLVFPELSLSDDTDVIYTEELTVFSGGSIWAIHLGTYPAFREAWIGVDHG